MPRPSPYESLDRDRAATLRRRHRLVGLAVILALAVGLLWARGRQLSAGDDAMLERGAAELWRAVDGDPTAFARAREAFEDATRAAIFDQYPAFALALTERLARGETAVSAAALQPAVDALARGELDAAERELEGAQDAAGYTWLVRLIADMRKAAGPRP